MSTRIENPKPLLYELESGTYNYVCEWLGSSPHTNNGRGTWRYIPRLGERGQSQGKNWLCDAHLEESGGEVK